MGAKCTRSVRANWKLDRATAPDRALRGNWELGTPPEIHLRTETRIFTYEFKM